MLAWTRNLGCFLKYISDSIWNFTFLRLESHPKPVPMAGACVIPFYFLPTFIPREWILTLNNCGNNRKHVFSKYYMVNNIWIISSLRTIYETIIYFLKATLLMSASGNEGWEHGDSGRLSNLLKVTQQVNNAVECEPSALISVLLLPWSYWFTALAGCGHRWGEDAEKTCFIMAPNKTFTSAPSPSCPFDYFYDHY